MLIAVSRRTRFPRRRVVVPAALALLGTACGGAAAEGPPAPPATTCPIPVAVTLPTFSGHVLPALRQSCGAGDATSCHGATTAAGRLSYARDLAATQVRAELVGVAPANAPAGWVLVAAGDPDHSWLVEKVTRDDPGGVGQARGNRMPYGAPNLCDATVQTLRSWIALGALDD